VSQKSVIQTSTQVSASAELFETAQTLLPGGVNSPVRGFRSVGGTPRFIESAKGAHVRDVDGNTYIDYVCSWGPLIAGHAHQKVVEAITSAAERGTSYGAPTRLENELAETVIERMPSIERIRFVSSGTEAAMSAVRLARAATGREMIVKFDGCYHGHADSMLVSAGSGVLTLGQPDSPGVPKAVAQATLSIPFNSTGAIDEAFAAHGADIAAVMVEPVAGNMGVIEADSGYLQHLRDVTSKHGALLVFDEVITGFRVARGGAQERYGVQPDLTVLGKVIGGGLPVGAYGGRLDLMNLIAPVGPVYQAGTLSGNPLAMAAGLATLRLLDDPGVYDELEARAGKLGDGLLQAAQAAGLPVSANRVASMMTLFFTAETVRDYASAKQADTGLYGRYFGKLLDRGVYFAPSQFEAGFVSLAHSDDDIDATLEAAGSVFTELAAG
jgi:glutamate-1-semialdehyde 2,1-aminomutase